MCKCLSHFSNEAPIGGATNANAAAPRELLPADLVPVNYNIRIAPSLETFEFDGTVAIEANVVSSTKTVTVNSKNLKVHKAWIAYAVSEGSVRRQEAKEIVYDKDLQRVTFVFLEEIPAGVVATVTSEFTGVHNDLMAGFYRSSYVDDAGNKRYMLVTQFESTDARQCIPCFDEPALKATFDVTLVVAEDLTALSNMNDISTVFTETASGKKFKEVTFARTPLMSTYLLAFVVGDLECIETTSVPKKPASAQPITVRLFTTKGLVEQGRFALETAARTLEYFSEYFDEAYPLPKSDMVAIPDFSAGAMENWGLVTYRNVYLLCDEKKATANQKKMIGYIVGHELAHQWFGNLVTMTWWNDLWLNEGFATFVGWLSTDYLFPEWDVWTGFITGEMSQALNLDGLRSSHPIDVDVKSAKEVDEIFDAISYSKGASVIRMLNDFLGGQVFMDGVRTYLQEFKYKNTVTADLWKHLSASSGKDIASLMRAWTREMGYPLVSVQSEVYDDAAKTLTVSLSQSRFLSGGELKPEEDTVNWWVPITVVSHLTGKTGATRHVLSEKQGTITFPYDASTDAFWKLNFGASGLYRVKYLDSQVAAIGKILETKPETFSVGDRIMFLSDALRLTMAGFGNVSTLLNMIKSLASETDYNVLLEISSTLGTLRSFSYLEPQSVIDGLKALGRTVFSSKVAQLGYDFPENDEHFAKLTRALAIGTAERSGDESVKAELRSRFDLFIAGDESALHPELRGIAFRSVLSNATPENAEALFASIWGIYTNPANQANERNVALGSVGAINSFEHIDRILNTYIFDQDIIKSQDFHMPLSSIVQFSPSPAIVRPVLVEWFQTSFSKITAKFPDGRALGMVLSLAVGGSIGENVLAEVNAFIRGEGLSEDDAAIRVKEFEPAKRAIDQVLESVTTKTKFMGRERENLAAFFSS
ncbi:UNVERIFIED_CONTAM: Aminopeptidase 2 mitochondrial [Siphonaria sp. JEL0065]|nr:Aminopeptidase 2 mitochondrial [Siphonaria sp. JEL0065]